MISRLLSCVLTPWAIFVSSSVSLYLRNQQSLNYNTSVLLPFLLAAVVGVLVGYGIQYDSEKNRHFPAAPWLFYLAGPAFMVWNTVDARLEGGWAIWFCLIAVLVVWVAASLVLRGRPARRVAPYFAIFAVLIIAWDLQAFVTQAQRVEPASRTPEPAQFLIDSGGHGEVRDDLPNIYHVVLDGYQSDMFEITLEDALRSSLDGFRFYRNNMGIHANTRLSIPAVFAGRPWRGAESLESFTRLAFGSPDSLLSRLKSIGYFTSAFLHQEFAFGEDDFDEVFFHHQFAASKPWSDRAFLWVWVYAYWPEPVARYFLGEGSIERIRAGDLSPEGYAVVSIDTFERFLAREATLPAKGRYTFLHLIVPHPPYVLNAKCEARESVSELEQYRCANRLVARLLAALKEQGKFADSVIVFHADHGDDLDVDGLWIRQMKHMVTDVEYLKIRSRTLLLYKPPGETADEGLLVDDKATTLLDIPATILTSVGAVVPDTVEGIPLAESKGRSRPREFYIHDGVRLYQWLVADDSWQARPSSVIKPPLEDGKE